MAEYAVMASYGRTMLAVQAFEQVLAAAVMIAQLRASIDRRQVDQKLSAKTLERRLARYAKRTNHLFHHASAAELRNELRGKFDQTLLDHLDPLIEWRDFLAHRYLFARIADHGIAAKLTLKQSPIDELAELALAFQDAAKRVDAVVQSMTDDLPKIAKPAPEDAQAAVLFRHALSAHTRMLVTRQPKVFSRPPDGSPPAPPDGD